MSLSTVLFLVLIIIVAWIVGIYNSLVRGRTQTEEAWSDIDVQLKRRYDLIPNMLEAVKGYMKHESQTLEKITQARAAAMQAQTIADKSAAENVLTQSLKSLFALSENYPQLRASENFAKLQDELSDTENKIQAARRFYNANARDYNIKLKLFPNNLLAGKFGFTSKEFFEIENEKEKETVQVKF
ncbi:MAG: LemA family protein [Parcubacteria group bacterium]|nr:LemA family protein [Parcubacteria group bacterium]